jgi:hypothetical protein
MSVFKTKSSGARQHQRRLDLRTKLWPKVSDTDLWIRQDRKGFTTIPRGLPLIMRIIDLLTNRQPASSTYFDLWAMVYDEGFVQIKTPHERAFSAGGGGSRAVYTWGRRMRSLERLGLISSSAGAAGPYSNVLILNPYKVLKTLESNRRTGFPRSYYNAPLERMNEIGADDIDPV